MITRFEVRNFKQFKEDGVVMDFADARQYEFNKDCIRNGIINTALIYGPNGCGKSNLGCAIMDLARHLIDINLNIGFLYQPFLNAESATGVARFKYEFLFAGTRLIYCYDKNEKSELLHETLHIDGSCVLEYQRGRNLQVRLRGAENLNTDLGNYNISGVRYVVKNTRLASDPINATFYAFYEFVEKMLLFRSLSDVRFLVNGNLFIGNAHFAFEINNEIVEKDHLQDFENFLNEAGIVCRLRTLEHNGNRYIAFAFGQRLVQFSDAASTGTQFLALFYAWFQRIKTGNDVSFVYIDEFDAYCHHELAALLVRKLREVGVQVVLTTHNTYLMTNELLRPDCYFVMSEKAIKSLPNCTQKELRQAHNLEKMYLAGAFDV